MGDIGEAFREGFEMLFEEMAQYIVVHEKFNTSEASSYEVKGLKNTEGKGSRQVIFQFLEPLNVHVGSVLQIKGSRDYWRVTDTEDKVEDGVFLNFEARVEKVNLAGQPTRPSVRGSNTFNLHGAQPRVNIQSQDNSINISHQTTENVFADLRQVIQANIHNEEERTEILNKLSELEEAKGKRGFTQKYQEFIATAANHIGLLSPFIPALTQMLGGSS